MILNKRAQAMEYFKSSAMIFNMDLQSGAVDKQAMVDLLDEFSLKVCWQDRLGAYTVHKEDGTMMQPNMLQELFANKVSQPEVCKICGGKLEDTTKNEFGVQCDTCPYPFVEYLED